MSKYHAVPAVYNGQRYDSTGEVEYARTLDLKKAAGQIRDWRRGTEWVLLESPTGRRRDAVHFTPDFEVWDTGGALRVVDFKGVVTGEFRLRAKIWRAVYPSIPLVIAKADGSEQRV